MVGLRNWFLFLYIQGVIMGFHCPAILCVQSKPNYFEIMVREMFCIIRINYILRNALLYKRPTYKYVSITNPSEQFNCNEWSDMTRFSFQIAHPGLC